MNKTKTLQSHFKFIPLISVLGFGLVLTPVASIAGNNDRGNQRVERSKSSDNHHDRGNYRSKKHNVRESRHNSHKRSLGHKLNHNDGARYSRRYTQGHRKRVRYYPRYDHHYDHRGRGTSHYVINDNHYSDRYVDYDHLGFMIGLHTNNFDITFRD